MRPSPSRPTSTAPMSRVFWRMTRAGSESGTPRGGSVRTARALPSCWVISEGPARNAMPQVGEPPLPRPQAATARVSASSRKFMIWNLTLMGPNSSHGHGPHGREGLGHQVVDVIEHIGRHEPQLDRALFPACSEVQHLHGDAPRVDEPF